MLKVGFIGWRGMVGSVLMSRMVEMKDFQGLDAYFFSTSQVGEAAPDFGGNQRILFDAHNLNILLEMDVIVSCQGGSYTEVIHPQLRQANWQGYWIDAASTLRLKENAIIVLDPLNGGQIETGLRTGIKDYIGGNCTVSLMALAISGLLKENLVEWISSMTYQAISGSGAAAMEELLTQSQLLSDADDAKQDILSREKHLRLLAQSDAIPHDKTAKTLAYNLLPWIDVGMENGQTKEEFKAGSELNKMLATSKIIPVDGICVRVPALRSHSQALTVKLKKPLDIETITHKIANGNEWVKLVDNNKEATLEGLTPQATSGSFDIAIGRIKPSLIGEDVFHCFTVGDQLLWGAAEPLRRMLGIVREFVKESF